MKPGQTENVPSNPPVIPPANGDIPMQAGIGSIVVLMLMIVFARLILGQPPTKQ
jgi:hypothetical protein